MIKNTVIFFKWLIITALILYFFEVWMPENNNLTFVQLLKSVLDWICSFTWINQYQSLIASAIALYSAIWAGRAVYKQTEDQNRIHRNLIDGKRAAAKATLPFVLSQIGGYLEACTSLLVSAHEQCVEGQLPKSAMIGRTPDIDSEVFNTLKENVEFDYPNRLFLSNFIATWQIQHSRILSLHTDLVKFETLILKNNIEQYLYDTAELYAQVTAIFDFVRKDNVNKIRSVKNSDVLHALTSMLADKNIELGLELSKKAHLVGTDVWQPSFKKFPKSMTDKS